MSGDTALSEQQLLNRALQAGVLNALFFDRINHILDTQNKSEALQTAINNVMSRIQQLMITGGDTPGNREALGNAARMLEGLVTKAGNVNASGPSIEINTGGAREILTSVESSGGVAHVGSATGSSSPRSSNVGIEGENRRGGRTTAEESQNKRDQFEKAMESSPDGVSSTSKSSTGSAQAAKDNSTPTAATPTAETAQSADTANSALSPKERMRLALLNAPEADAGRPHAPHRSGQALRVANAKAVADTESPPKIDRHDGGPIHLADNHVRSAAPAPA